MWYLTFGNEMQYRFSELAYLTDWINLNVDKTAVITIWWQKE